MVPEGELTLLRITAQAPKHAALAYMHTVDSCDSNAVYSPGSSPTPYVSIVLSLLLIKD